MRGGQVIFFNDTATNEIYTRSLHDALPISPPGTSCAARGAATSRARGSSARFRVLIVPSPSDAEFSRVKGGRSEAHTSELQSRQYLVCRLLLENIKP